MKPWNRERAGISTRWAAAAIAAALVAVLAVSAQAAGPNLTLTATDAEIGEAIHATAQLSESTNATGEISFEVFGPNDPTCLGPALTPAPAPVEVTGDGQYDSGDFTPSTAGTYHWSAQYPGDEENPAAASTCTGISTVAKASPGLTAEASDATAGSPIDDEATLTGGFSPGGNLVFRAYGPGDASCANAPKYEEAVAIAGNGTYSPAGFAPAAGSYHWTVEYAGDANNDPASTSCGAADQTSTVDKASPNLSGVATGAVTVGQSITDSATLSGGFSPGGQLVFRAYGPGDASCSNAPAYENAVAVAGNGSYAPVGFLPAPGTYRWTVEYEGDASNEADSTNCGAANQSSVVSKASPALSGVATSAVSVGQSITDSATLSGGISPSGQLVFRAYGPSDASCANAPKYEEAVAIAGNGTYAPAGFSPGPGTYRWTVEYAGDANNEADSTSCGAANQTSAVSKASPTLAGVATASVQVGQSITDSAILAGGFAPTGKLTFRAYGPSDPTCSNVAKYEEEVTIAGNGSYAPVGLSPAPGTYQWTVEYEGDANNAAAISACGAANQTSTVNKASPTLTGTATSALGPNLPITDNVDLAAGFAPTGELVFRLYGPGDETCATAPKYEKAVPIASGNGSYPADDFSPTLPGLYRWTVEYAGDANNAAVSLGCGASSNQSSAVGPIPVNLAAGASGATVGDPVTATATISKGAIPAGQLTFKAFLPGDTSCSGAAAFSSTVAVAGNGTFSSAAFAPTRVGTYRWTVGYSGDPNHTPATVDCGKATSSVVQAKPSIAGQVKQRLSVGTAFRDWVTLKSGYSPGGTITFRIYGPVASGCAQTISVNTVAVTGNGTYKSDPIVAQRPGRYSFVASYSGDAANQAAAEPCDAVGQAAQVQKREPKVKPSARLIGPKRISIRAHLSGGASPSGVINFRLYGPGHKTCKGRPAFAGAITVKANGSYSLAEYFATKRGVYRLEVGYSGDQRNQRFNGSCSGAQTIRVG